MMQVGRRKERFTLELKFDMDGLDNNALHAAFRGQDLVDLVFMGKSIKVRLSELRISYDGCGVDTYCAGEAVYK